MVWYGMVWYGMVWYGMVWYGILPEGICCCYCCCEIIPLEQQDVFNKGKGSKFKIRCSSKLLQFVTNLLKLQQKI